MRQSADIRKNIERAIMAFDGASLSDAGISLFATLGYDTKLQAPLDSKTYGEFKSLYIDSSPAGSRFSGERAFAAEWQSIDILFQLTDESFSRQGMLFDSKLNVNNPQSYLCFAIELGRPEYTKTQIAAITREINKIFTIPVVIIFRYGKYITISVINRHINKRDSSRDVLEKVTLIKDIVIRKPHRAHIEILFDMSLGRLSESYEISNFETLHKAWSEVLDTQALNRRFYTELSNWYFWAIKTVVYPGYENEADLRSVFSKEDKIREHNAKNLIRLLTRLLFVWFIKEKGLIPEELFDEGRLCGIIKGFNPHLNDCEGFLHPIETDIYYKAVLQNLFFASLNAEQGQRKFRIDGQNQNATSLMRYKIYHHDPENFIKLVESKVPFMNGGLFECLDHQSDTEKGQKGGAKIIYEDGFSDRKDNELFVPDYIFFGKNINVDLSTEYDDKKKKQVVVNGIIHILQKYKFTIAENTPVEEDIALDPELLGRVFENLLASYNPETKTNARKMTGSFYTPRPIVEYMVDQSLKAYLKTKMTENEQGIDEGIIDKKLDSLIAYNEAEPDFTEKERICLLNYIDQCRILDPACGSGAFPMGILQKMVYVMHKLDPDNDRWKQIQIQKISNDENLSSKEKNDLQKEILSVFDDNELDYARKLYLIENCIHGIDIQPIATQISRLRFFISLIVDQKVDGAKPNFGIRPLPNLENRFVTANSLIGLNDSGYLSTEKKDEIMKQLQKVRHDLFKARTPKHKSELRKKDRQIRETLKQELINADFGEKNAEMIAAWDPYDKNRSAEFFDAEWMFGIKDGFDIVIGNPPYKVVSKEDSLKKTYDEKYEVAHGGKRNLYHLFFEKGINIVKTNGSLAYITPDTYFAGNDTEALRKFFLENIDIKIIIHYTEKDKIFENVTQAVAVIVIQKRNHGKEFTILHGENIETIKYENLKKENKYVFKSSNSIIDKIRRCKKTFADICEGYQGEVNLTQKKEFIFSNYREKTLPLIRGIQLNRYVFSPSSECCSLAAVSRNHTQIERIVFQEVVNMGLSHRVKGTLLKNVICGHSTNYIFSKSKEIDNRFLLAILNSKVVNYYFKFFNQTNHVPIGELKRIPFPVATPEQQAPIIALVDKILAAKKADPQADTGNLEHKIDLLVYKLYGLTYQEAKTIDPNLTETEYNTTVGDI